MASWVKVLLCKPADLNPVSALNPRTVVGGKNQWCRHTQRGKGSRVQALTGLHACYLAREDSKNRQHSCRGWVSLTRESAWHRAGVLRSPAARCLIWCGQLLRPVTASNPSAGMTLATNITASSLPRRGWLGSCSLLSALTV